MHKLYALKDMLCEELKQYGDKEKLDVASLEAVDKLAHALKNLDKVIETYEEQQMQQEYSNAMPRIRMNYSTMYPETSYARGRGMNARRDSMGRYSRNDGGGYSNMEMPDMPEYYGRRNMMDGM